MKKIMKRKTLILLSMGMLVFSASLMFSRLFEFSDLIKGSFIGIGLVLTSIISRNFQSV